MKRTSFERSANRLRGIAPVAYNDYNIPEKDCQIKTRRRKTPRFLSEKRLFSCSIFRQTYLKAKIQSDNLTVFSSIRS